MKALTRREILEGLRRQGIHGLRRIAKECRSFERSQKEQLVRELLREPRRLTEQGKLNRRLWNDACFMTRVGYCNTGGIDYLVTCQPRMGR